VTTHVFIYLSIVLVLVSMIFYFFLKKLKWNILRNSKRPS